MKIAGCMVIRHDPKRSTRIDEALRHLQAVSDSVFVLSDNSPPEYIAELRKRHPQVFSWTVIETTSLTVWNDWGKRAMLLVEAANNGFEWVFWLDHDETIWPAPNRERVENVIVQTKKINSAVCVRFPWLQLWNDEQTVRTDGFWSRLKKPFLQRNPFLQNVIAWPCTPVIPLHNFPIQHGTIILRKDFAIIHSGMMTREEREYRHEKYRGQDPSGKTDDIFMGTLESESAAVATPLDKLDLNTIPD